MPVPSWCYRFLHVSRAGAVFAYEECSHGAAFRRGFDGTARGRVCLDGHVFEWHESWLPKGKGGFRFMDQVWIRGRPAPHCARASIQAYIARHCRLPFD